MTLIEAQAAKQLSLWEVSPEQITPEQIMRDFVKARDAVSMLFDQYKAGQVEYSVLKAASDHHHEMRRLKSLYRHLCSDEVLVELKLQTNAKYAIHEEGEWDILPRRVP